MKLLKNEHEQIIGLMDAHHLTDQYVLIKRKGWVHVEVREQSFVFHRKKVTELVGGRFIDRFQYFIRVEGKAIPMADFDAVLHDLNNWLATVENNINQ